MIDRKVLVGLTILILQVTSSHASNQQVAVWSYEAVAATPRWRGFTERMQTDYLVPITQEMLRNRCEAVLAKAPLPLDKDAPGACIEAVLSSLDEYSEYIDAKTFAERKANSGKPTVGVGLEVWLKEVGQGLRVASTISGGPGDRAGIRQGDIILKIDDTDLGPMTTNDCVKALRGAEGSRVRLTVQRMEASDPVEIVAVRAEIRLLWARARMLTKNVAYARLSKFALHSAEDLARQLSRLRASDGATPTGLIFDLRSNPGGLLNQLPALASTLAPEKLPVVKLTGRMESNVLMTTASAASLDGRWPEIVPMVVLVDGKTQSAAEALAQFLKEARGAILVGESTSGGSFVTTTLSIGEEAGVKIITSKLSSPQNVEWPKGLTPDVSVKRDVSRFEFDDLRDNQLKAALDELTKQVH